jgi:hypothetical protein
VIGVHFAGEDLTRSRNRLAIACGVARKRPDGSGDPHPYEDLAAWAQGRIEPRPLADADVVMYALQYRPGEETRRVAEAAREAGLPCIFFRPNDDPTPATPPWGVVYRTSLYRGQMAACERAMPALTDDLLQECGGEVVVRRKRERASVGFCGYVGSARERLFRITVGRVLGGGQRDKAVGIQLRHRALESLRRSSAVDANLIARTQLWGGAVRGTAEFDEARRAAVRREFLDNLIGSDYCLALRGKGNYSFRLYEVFAMGRIPVFVDTLCVLPWEDEIDWRRHCVWVDESEIDRTAEIVAQFHADLHADDFEKLQLENRRLWLEFLSPEAIYTRILDDALRSASGRRHPAPARGS